MSMENWVLIAGGEERVGLAIVRSLGKKGIKCAVLSTTRLGAALYSKYCEKRIICPSPTVSVLDYLEFLKGLLKSKQYQILIPASSYHFLPIAENQEKLREYINVPIPSAEVIRKAMDKYQAIALAQNLGIPVPRTIVPKSEKELEEVFYKWGSPIVIKPRISIIFAGNRLKSLGRAHVVFSLNEVRQFDFSSGLYLAQEYVPGEGYGFFALFKESRLLAKFCHHRLHEVRAEGGVSSLRESYKDEVLEELGSRLLQGLNWHGVAMVEFRKDFRDGKYKLMEINCRFWGSLQLSIVAGVDFPYLLYGMVTGKGIENVPEYREGILCRWFFPGEVYRLLDVLNVVNRDKKNLKGKYDKIKEVKEFFKYFFLKNVGYDIFSVSDPLPSIFYFLTWIRRFKNIR